MIKQLSPKQVILVLLFITILALSISIILQKKNKKKKEIETKPIYEETTDYNEYMHQAIIKHDEVQSALIYKDTKKVIRLLNEAKINLEKIDISSELYEDAQKLLEENAEMKKKVKDIEKKLEKEKEEM
jgi:hypothetical protein